MHRRPLARVAARRLFAAAASVIAGGATSASALVIDSWTGYPGTDVWGNPGNWSTGSVPTSGDQATVYAGPVTLYATPPTIGSLLVSHLGAAGQVFTNGFKLNVLNRVDLDGTNAGLYVYSAPAGSVSVQSPIYDLTNGGLIDMQTGGSRLRASSSASGTPNGIIAVDATSTVRSYGTIDTDTYSNHGLLTSEAGPSTINAGTFTLAGTASNIATIDANGQAMTINAGTFELHNTYTKIDAGDFGSSLTMNGNPNLASGNIGADVYVGDSAQFSMPGGNAWLFGYYSKSGAIFVPNGSMNLNGGPTLARAAKVNQYATYFTNVNVTGYGNMVSAEFDGASNVNVAANGFLNVGSPYFRGTTFSHSIDLNGPGTIRTNGDMAIGYNSSPVPHTIVNVNAGTIFDWDGTSESAASLTIEDGELNIYTNVIDVAGFFTNYGYDGTINIASDSKLNVAGTAWTLYGSMHLSGGATVDGQAMTVNGSSLAAGNYSMYPSGVGGVLPTINAPLVLGANALVSIGSGGGLVLNGQTTYAGGGVASAPYVSPGQPYGTIVQNGNAFVTQDTTIYCNTVDMDGAANTATWNISAGRTLHMQAYSIDSANSTRNPFASTLTLDGGTLSMETNLGLWTLGGGTINMNQSGINLPFLTHDKLVLGAGNSKGTINVGANTTAYISGGLLSSSNTVAGGNVINVGSNSTLYVGPTFGSSAGAVLTKSGAGTLVVNVAQSHLAGSVLNVTQGELDLNSDAGAGGANLTINASGGTTVFSKTQRLNALTIAAGASVNVTLPATPSARSVIVTSLTMSGGKLDLSANDMIVHSGSTATIRDQLQQGSNGGAWNGAAGIVSSAAAASLTPKYALGYALNDNGAGVRLFSTFDGQPASLTDVIVKYTLRGDSNLDGAVNFADLVALAQQYNKPGTIWIGGDFNYDGTTNFSDLVSLAQNYNQVAATLTAAEVLQLNAAGGASFASDFALARSLVPEPTSAAAFGLIVIVLKRRRMSAR